MYVTPTYVCTYITYSQSMNISYGVRIIHMYIYYTKFLHYYLLIFIDMFYIELIKLVGRAVD